MGARGGDPGDDLMGVGERGVAVLAAVDGPRRRQAHQEQPPHSSLPPSDHTHAPALPLLLVRSNGRRTGSEKQMSIQEPMPGWTGRLPAGDRPCDGRETGMGENVCKFVGEDGKQLVLVAANGDLRMTVSPMDRTTTQPPLSSKTGSWAPSYSALCSPAQNIPATAK